MYPPPLVPCKFCFAAAMLQDGAGVGYWCNCTRSACATSTPSGLRPLEACEAWNAWHERGIPFAPAPRYGGHARQVVGFITPAKDRDRTAGAYTNWLKWREVLVMHWGSRAARNATLRMWDALGTVPDAEVAPDADGWQPLGMCRAPASRKRHHACEGGLVVHMLEMWEAYVALARDGRLEGVDPAEVAASITYHDLHKARTYLLHAPSYQKGEWVTRHVVARPELTDKAATFALLSAHGVRVTPVLAHVIDAAHGGFAKERPYNTSPLAKLIYVLDEYSANVHDPLRVAAEKAER